MKISQFKNFNVVTQQLTVVEALSTIKNGTFKNEIVNLRHALDNDKINIFEKLKKALPAYTFSGYFEGGRRLTLLKKYIPIILLDIDHCNPNNLQTLLTTINKNAFTMASFISPSGKGIKILVRIATGEEEHTNMFLAIQEYYQKLLKVKIDDSGKDITRLCFVSWDEGLFYNANSSLFIRRLNPESPINSPLATDENHSRSQAKTKRTSSTKEEKKQPSRKNDITPQEKIFEACVKTLQKKYPTFEPGNRNNYIFELSCLLHRKGIERYIALSLVLEKYDFDSDEIQTALYSAYSRNIPTSEIVEENGAERKNRYAVSNTGDYKIGKMLEFIDQRYHFRYNEVTGHVEYKEMDESTYQNFTDRQLNNIWRDLSFKVSKLRRDDIRAIIHSDYSPNFNPFEDYFSTLPAWDHNTDYIAQLANTLEVAPTIEAHWHRCFKKWLVALVGCALNKEITNQTVLSISGEQGKGKTTWIENLMPQSLKSYILTGRIIAKEKDSLMSLSDCLIINLDELDKMSNSDLNSLKSIITRPSVKFRRPYDKYTSNEPRRASFAGSTNCNNFLTDSTGNRRFLCFESLNINYQHNVNLELVYSQAYALFKSDFPFWFNAQEQIELEKFNQPFIDVKKEEELFLTYFEIIKDLNEINLKRIPQSIPGSNLGQIVRLTASDILARIVERSRLNTICHSTEMGKLLKRLGAFDIYSQGRRTYLVRERSYDEVNIEQRA